MSEARQRAIDKQLAAGNDPESTRCNPEIWRDHNPYVITGKEYRVRLNLRLEKRDDEVPTEDI